MHRLSSAHLNVMRWTSDSKRFSNPDSRPEVQSRLKAMVNATAAIVHDEKAPNADPVIQYSAEQFANEVRQASMAFDANDLPWARYSIYRTSSYCISCHTRADRGVRDFDMPWNYELTGLTPSQRVEFLLANRRYSSALGEAMKLAGDADFVKKDAHGWIVSIERVLAMVIRVNKNPAQAESLVEAALKNQSAPSYLRRDVAGWLSDIREWKREKPKKVTVARAADLARRAATAGGNQRWALVMNLRASGMIHELLENYKAKTYSETLFYAGLVEESLHEINLGTLDQYYYEACIKEAPHSELAEHCYSRLENAVRTANPYLELEPRHEMQISNDLQMLQELSAVKDELEHPVWAKRWWQEESGVVGEKEGH